MNNDLQQKASLRSSKNFQEQAKLVRKWCLISTTEAGSGHPTSCLSAADIMTVLFDKYYTYDIKDPLNKTNDRLVFSKGHAAPLLYTLYALAGAFPIEELKTLRKFNSRLEGHPTPKFPYAEAATGSLGQGLSVGAGLAIGIKREMSNGKDMPKVYVLLGDGEMAEGQVWEAANFSGYYKLDNLIAIVDDNRLGQSQETMFGHHSEEYIKRLQAFGWEVMGIDGHDFEQIEDAFEKAIHNSSGKPFAIVAKTQKGHGISFLADQENWHGKPVPKDKLDEALKELGEVKDEVVFHLPNPQDVIARNEMTKQSREIKENIGTETSGIASPISELVRNDVVIPYKIGDQIATREVYGKVLAELGKTNESLIVLDAEVKNSTFSIDFLKVYPDRFIECFIAEQNMVSVAAGLSRFGKQPFVSTFAAFFTRAFDQVRMAWLSQANIKFVGSHAGISIGEDGASQMGLEELSMFGSFPGVIVLQPCDAVSAAKLLAQFITVNGIGYLQTLRPKTTVIYDATEEFPIGGSKLLAKSDQDILTVVATGITVSEVLKAYEQLKQENIFIRVIDAYSLAPIDKETLIASASATKQRVLITVEDHFIHGGLGDFVLAAVAEKQIIVEKMAVTRHSHSGLKDELLDDAGISAKHVVEKVKGLMK